MSKPLYKTIPIRVEMEPLGKCVTKKRQIGEEEISKQSGFLFKKTSKQTKPVYEEYEDWIPLGVFQRPTQTFDRWPRRLKMPVTSWRRKATMSLIFRKSKVVATIMMYGRGKIIIEIVGQNSQNGVPLMLTDMAIA